MKPFKAKNKKEEIMVLGYLDKGILLVTNSELGIKQMGIEELCKFYKFNGLAADIIQKV